MDSIEEGVTRHYSAYDVLANIRAGLEAMGRDPNRIEPGELKKVDEFHIGGAEATTALLSHLDIKAGMDVLDIGSGIGGPARLIALQTGAKVTGVDLTPAFVEAANVLTSMAGMEGSASFEVGSAVDLPFADASFHLATLLHVGMNIPDKPRLFREAFRVLRPHGVFAVYDVMRTGGGELMFPVPWAEEARLSALDEPQAYRSAAHDAGFALAKEEDRKTVALEFFERIRAQASSAKPDPLGLHLLMGPTVGVKTGNMMSAIREGTIAPIQMIFRKN